MRDKLYYIKNMCLRFLLLFLFLNFEKSRGKIEAISLILHSNAKVGVTHTFASRCNYDIGFRVNDTWVQPKNSTTAMAVKTLVALSETAERSQQSRSRLERKQAFVIPLSMIVQLFNAALRVARFADHGGQV